MFAGHGVAGQADVQGLGANLAYFMTRQVAVKRSEAFAGASAIPLVSAPLARQVEGVINVCERTYLR